MLALTQTHTNTPAQQQGAGVSCGLDPDRERKDSQWNYHVWTEVWMKRPDYGVTARSHRLMLTSQCRKQPR